MEIVQGIEFFPYQVDQKRREVYDRFTQMLVRIKAHGCDLGGGPPTKHSYKIIRSRVDRQGVILTFTITASIGTCAIS